MGSAPQHLDLDRSRGLTVRWADGSKSFYPVAHLRRWSPSAEARQLREELEANKLTVLPSGGAGGETLQASDLELVGGYAVRIIFSDGHRTGLYTWDWLRRIDPAREPEA